MYCTQVNVYEEFAHGTGYWVELVPDNYSFTGRIKYVKTEGRKTQVYFEIEYTRYTMAFRFWPMPFFYKKALPPKREWIRDDWFNPHSEEIIVECEK